MKKITHQLIVLCSLWLGISTSFGATITVSSASDIANSNAKPGDILLMSKSANWANQDIILNFNGTSTQPITLKAEGSGQVILSGGATLQIGGTYTVVDGLTFKNCASTEGGDLVKFKVGSTAAQNCRLTNCLFTDNNPTDLNIGYKWVSLYGKNNRVDHCWFELKNHRGTTLVVWLEVGQEANYHRIDHNYFTRPELSTGNNEAESIRIGDSNTSLTTSRTTVENNFFEACDGEIEVISNKSCYNVYQNNTFFENAAILTLRHGHYCTVQGNYFFGNNKSGSGGVRIIGVGHKVINNYMQDLAGSGNLRAPIVIMGGIEGLGVNDATNRYVAAQDNLVAFNTMVNCNQNIYVGSDKTTSSETYKAPSNNTIVNNIIFGTKNNAITFEKGEIASFTYGGNLYNGMSLGAAVTGFSNTNPQLTLGTGFTPARIKSTSPAINASVGTYNYPLDFDGEARKGVYDIGCDEYYASAPLRTPTLKTEVGPCWKSSNACEVVTEVKDCAGVTNGTASVDNCGVCSGGTTGKVANSSCSQDCAGVWKGTAKVDRCNVCSGGSTGKAVDACLDCGAPKATSEDGANVAANVLDKNLGTRWSALGIGQYIDICLNDTILLKSVSIAFHQGNLRSTTFDVQTSLNGQTWTTLISNKVSSGTTLALEEFTVTPTNAWKLRIIGKGNSSPSEWNSITEIEWSSVVTGLNDFSFDNTSVAPNPTTGKLNILGFNNTAIVDVYDTMGNKIKSSTVEEISLENNSNGIYILRIEGKTFKVVKQ